MARGTVVGHPLECAGQLTGGYYADPGVKDVPDMAHLGFPYADVARDGTALFSKVAGTGGVVNLRTAKEQLLYEVTAKAVKQHLAATVAGEVTRYALPNVHALQFVCEHALGAGSRPRSRSTRTARA